MDYIFTNKYAQGSVWQWENEKEYKAGVQGGERPVLIVSNNTYNQFSPSVTCVTITSVLKDSPVHVPVYITKDSHIQCEQLHTIPKEELTEYICMVANSVLSNVKMKLKYQFDIDTDKDIELLVSIKRSIDRLNNKAELDILHSILTGVNALNAKAEKRFGLTEIVDKDTKLLVDIKERIDCMDSSAEPDILCSILSGVKTLNSKAETGFGLPEVEEDFLELMVNLHNSIEKIIKDVENLKSENIRDNSMAAITQNTSNVDSVIQTGTSTLDLDANEISESGKKKGRRKYTEEDKKFIADKANSIDSLMERYGFTRINASRMRTYFRKRLGDSDRSDASTKQTSGNSTDSNKNNKKTSEKLKRQAHRYTDEDKAYILDQTNSLEDLMEKFNFKDRNAAYKARAYIQKIAK